MCAKHEGKFWLTEILVLEIDVVYLCFDLQNTYLLNPKFFANSCASITDYKDQFLFWGQSLIQLLKLNKNPRQRHRNQQHQKLNFKHFN
jgi:hypothetical protein